MEPAIFIQDTPDWSPVSNQVTFAGRSSISQHDLYIVDVPVDLPETGGTFTALTQLTNDNVDETWPNWSPTGQQLVYVANTRETGIDGIDLWVIDIASGVKQNITNDGLSVIETAPDWGGENNNYIVYSATVQGENQSDIWIVPVDTNLPPASDGENGDTETSELDATPTMESAAQNNATAAPMKIIDLGRNDIQPRWSPDGRYIVFSSDAYGEYDIFVYDLETEMIYGITNNPDNTDIAGDWIN